MSEVLLELDRVSKKFRSHWTFRPRMAVKDVSLQVMRGEAFGFLGHNGAGKTTTIKCILGLIHKNSGRILLDGQELVTSAQRAALGYLPEQAYFYEHLTVEETLEFYAALHGLDRSGRAVRIAELLELVELADRRKSRVHTLSKGLQQRVGIAQAIINRPKLLFLDEPFSGLDPLGRMKVREIILDLRAQGTTIFLSSHILSDVEDICDRVAIMARGALKAVFSLRESAHLFGEAYEVSFTGLHETLGYFAELCDSAERHTVRQTSWGDVHVFRYKEYEEAQRAVRSALAWKDTKLLSFDSVGMSLEDIFLSITEEAKSISGSLPALNGPQQEMQ